MGHPLHHIDPSKSEADPEPDHEVCRLCSVGHPRAVAVAPDYQGSETPVCGTHANALEDGGWDGTEYEVVDYDDE